jgi:dTDP-glucose pyrophosphorylase
MLNIVVPMAGRGSRFANAGYQDPKPLIRFGGKPMIQWVVGNVTPKDPHRFIFLCLEEHLRQYPDIPTTLRSISSGCEILPVEGVTEGAACTVLLARRWIDSDEPLMIANSDQFVSLGIDEYLAVMENEHADGLIMTFEADDPKWSYCRLRPNGTVSEVVEKQVISNEATVGIYNFKHGRDFVRAADRMIADNLRVNNEFYVAPTYNQLIAEGAKIVVARTGREYAGMYGLGIPSDLDFFMTTAAYDHGRAVECGSLSDADRLCCLTRHVASCLLAGNRKGLAAVLDSHVRFRVLDGRAFTGRERLLRDMDSIVNRLTGRKCTPRATICGAQMSEIGFIGNDGMSGKLPQFVLSWANGVVTEIDERAS